MATAPSPPVLIWQPGGGVSSGPISNPPVYSQKGITPLVIGQSYIDVLFGSTQVDNMWVLVECDVVNTTDLTPLNIWPGITTSRTTAGFRLYLNGLPDTGNYYLHWAVSGVNIAPIQASTYLLTGPGSGAIGVALTFTVALPPSTTLPAPVVITPSDAGGGGVFIPTSVTLSTGSASATFTYAPASYGVKTISTTNSGTLTNPAAIILSVYSSTYTFTGPSTGGGAGVPSTNFTVALPVGGGVSGTVTVTPNDSGGSGTFTPSTVALTTGAPSATFTYTPASGGTKTLSVTNNGGLTDPGSLSYTPAFSPGSIAGLKVWLKADSLVLSNGAFVSTWSDQSGNGNDVTQLSAGEQGTFQTNVINSLPVVNFPGTGGGQNMNSAPGGLSGVSTAASVFIVQRKNALSATLAILSAATSPTNSLAVYLPYSDNSVYFDLGDTTATGRITGPWGGSYGTFYYWSFIAGGGNMAVYRSGTTVLSSSGHTNSFNPTGLSLLVNGGIPSTQNADIAEVLIYNTALGTTDRTNVENYLKTKYGL